MRSSLPALVFLLATAGCGSESDATDSGVDAAGPCLELCAECVSPDVSETEGGCCDGLYCELGYGGPSCEVQDRDVDPDLCDEVANFTGPCDEIGTLCNIGSTKVVCFCDGWHILDYI